ncbi:MAG: FtsW/RodA/SpoVE family cell cycle protein [Lachnospiraceae bacterium]|nr:FtsW/RodA/SpoVE family cell cycle protein [Lachnospiraceae bacterium]
MNLFVSEISKYFITAFMAAYTLMSYITLKYKDGDHRKGIYRGQAFCIFMIHTLGMFCIYASTEDMDYLVLFYAQIFVLFIFERLMMLAYGSYNRQIMNHMKLLLSIGFIIQARLSFDKARRLLIIITISLLLCLTIPILIKKLAILKSKTFIFGYGFLGAALLAFVYALGTVSYGSKLSMKILGLAFQPSEFVKIIFAFFLAGLLYQVNRLGRLLLSAVLSAIYVLLLVASKDLGAALIYCIIYLAIVYASTGKHRYLLGGVMVGGLAGVAAYYLFAHVRVRIGIWLDPWSDVDTTGYQLTQSLFGIGMGDWFGRGLGRGIPETIPFVDEDFVFSAIAEEMGVVFGILLIMVYLNIVLLFLQIAQRMKDSFYRLAAVGIAVSLGIQTFLTIGGGSRLIPLTGVTLPLISNGGSSAMATIMMFGIMLGVSLLRQEELKAVEREGEETEAVDEIYVLLEMKRKRGIFLLGTIYIVLFLLMCGNLVYFTIAEREEVINFSYNHKRQELLAEENCRGTIYAADGTVLAETLELEDGTQQRSYPYGDLYAHVIGYVPNGGAGVEQAANMMLLNSSITLPELLANQWEGRKNPGDSVYTSLDPELQQIAYDSLGIYHGAVIVTEAKTGRILAMVSKPDYDPNEIEIIWEDLISDEESSVLVNRVTQGLYPPGSTFKIFTALEYMRQNPDAYTQYHFVCNGYFRYGEETINCFHRTLHGDVDFMSSFARSCNSSFANIGVGLDRGRFADTLLSLLFNSKLPVNMVYNPSHISMRDDMSDGEIMQTAIGQSETLITPLHLNMVTQAIANHGVMMTPYVIDHVSSADGNIVRQYEPVAIGSVMTEEETDYLTRMMIEVVEHGTATKLSGYGFTAAGKTGSAEYLDNKDGRSHAWFTGFAPAEDPEIVVTVILEAAGTGGDYSAPIARRIFSRYFD